MSSYHAFKNKPILNIDPNGANDGDYYSKDGQYLGNDGIDDDKAYVADGKNDDGTFKNATELSVPHSVLLKFLRLLFIMNHLGNYLNRFQ